MTHRDRLLAPLVVAVSMLIAGCQGTIEREVIPFALDSADTTLRTSEYDTYGKTVVLSATGEQNWFSLALVSTNSMGVIAETGEAPRLVLKGWKALQGKLLTYGKAVKVDTVNGTIAYEHFSFEGNSCFHFHKLNHRSMKDNWVRYRQLLTGYVCERGAEGIPDKIVLSFLNKITVPHYAFYTYEKDSAPVTLFKPVRPVRARMVIEPRLPGN